MGGGAHDAARPERVSVCQDSISYIPDHVLHEEPKVTALSVVRRGNVPYTVRADIKLKAFMEAGFTGVLRIIDCDGVPAISSHQGEAGDIRRSVAYIDHVFERDGPHILGHVVIYILVVGKHALIDAEQELGLCRMRDYSFWKGDFPIRLAEFATKDSFHVWLQGGAIKQGL